MTLPQDAKQLFDEMIPAALSKFPDRAKEVGAVYAFKITGDGGGEWTVDLVSSPPTCIAGDSGKAQCSIEVAHDDFKQMLANPAMGMQLFFQGKLRVNGDPMLATKLQQFFQLASDN
ncbi:MAG: SCP2 sterol-binding domain-containing protein [Deltaproteobacteria bacterium]|nr:SCP2 sterol-binding domain-containing protein [Deltaproteobacteria bacterium]